MIDESDGTSEIDRNPEAAKMAALLSLYFGAETEEELEEARRLGPLIARMGADEVRALLGGRDQGPLRHSRSHESDTFIDALR